eukprot:TRINITY_DN9155_c0_g1_i1.p1 TRINITY_DN9155_c0_g1~~TRINITY_DN9155_c0_g1_i1.p1  ORF type:complete len:151 (+),score=22.78 TRINITY_DN9155_c0_g1_i1:232-684(+)
MAESFRDVEPESFESSWASNDNPIHDDHPIHHTDYAAIQQSGSVTRRLTRPGMAEDLDVDSEEEDPTPAPSPSSHHHVYKVASNQRHQHQPVASPPTAQLPQYHQQQQQEEPPTVSVNRQHQRHQSDSSSGPSSRPIICLLYTSPSPRDS